MAVLGVSALNESQAIARSRDKLRSFQILSRHAMKRQYRRIDPGAVKVILLDAGDRVVPAFSEKLSAKAGRALTSIGVTVREGSRVTSIDRDGVTIEGAKGEERIAAKTVIWAAGVHAAGLTELLARATGASTDRGGSARFGFWK